MISITKKRKFLQCQLKKKCEYDIIKQETKGEKIMDIEEKQKVSEEPEETSSEEYFSSGSD